MATSSLPVQHIVEDCSGRTNSGFSLAPNLAYTDAANLHIYTPGSATLRGVDNKQALLA